MQNKANLFVILTQEILSDKKLTATDKLILARFSGFNVIFESSESTAEFLGISATYVRDSKRKLEKMGYLVCVRNTGRGKAYRLNLNSVFYGLDSANIDEQTSKIYQSESGNSLIRLSKFLSQSQEIPESESGNSCIENKEENKVINKKVSKKTESFDEIFIKKNVSDELKAVLLEFIKIRKLNGKKMTNHALELIIDKVRRLYSDEHRQIRCIEQSIENGWQGIFELKENQAVKVIGKTESAKPEPIRRKEITAEDVKQSMENYFKRKEAIEERNRKIRDSL